MIKLLSKQLQEYNENGYVIIPNIFTKEELEDLDQEIDRLDKEIDKSRSSELGGFILELALRSEKAKKFAEDERILNLIEDIVKPGIAIYSSKLSAKLPNSDEVCHWHQDDAYYVQKSNSDTRMSIWVPLQSANESNGCLWVVPQSHKLGLKKYEMKAYGTCRTSLIDEEHDFSEAIPVPVEAGSIVLFHALLWHRSNGNETDQTRRAFIVSYQEATVPAGNGKQWTILRQA